MLITSLPDVGINVGTNTVETHSCNQKRKRPPEGSPLLYFSVPIQVHPDSLWFKALADPPDSSNTRY